MDLRTIPLNNASVQTRTKRRRHSIAVVRRSNTLHDIPETPEEEECEKDRRRSVGNVEQKERPKSTSEPLYNISAQCYKDLPTSHRERILKSPNNPNDSGVLKAVDNGRAENPHSYKRSSGVDEENLIEAVSTYGNVIDAIEFFPSTTGSSFPQESSKETSDEDIALSEILRSVEAPMTTSSSRQGSVLDPDVLIVETSRSSSYASVVFNPDSCEASPESNAESGGSDEGSKQSSPTNPDSKQDMLGKILFSPCLTRRGSLGDVLKTLTPQFNTTADPARQDITKGPSCQEEGHLKKKVKEPEKLTKHQGTTLKSTHLSPQTHGPMKDPWRPLSPFPLKTTRDENPNLQENGGRKEKENNSVTTENGAVLKKIMSSPALTRRGSLGDVLLSLSPVGDRSLSVLKPISSSNRNRELHDKGKDCGAQKEDGNFLGKIMKSPTLCERRSSPGDVLRSLSPNDGGPPTVVVDTKMSPLAVVETECSGTPDKVKEGLLGKIIKSPGLTRRGSIGNVLNSLCVNPFISTTKSAADEDLSKTKPPVFSGEPKPKDTEKSSGISGPKGLLAIVQKHVMNHSPIVQRKRRNSIASTKPLTGALELSLRDSLQDDEWDFGNKPATDSKSTVVKTTGANTTKDASPCTDPNTKRSSDYKNKDNNSNILQPLTIKTCFNEDIAYNSKGRIVSDPCKDDEVKTPNTTDHRKPKEIHQADTDHKPISPTPRRLAESESMDASVKRSDTTSLTSPPRKTSAPLPLRNVHFPQRKTGVNIIKRSPVTFVISNNNAGENKTKRNGMEYQMASGVSFMSSRFLPLGQEEAEEYSMMKQEEEKKWSRKTSTINMSSRVTVYGENGSMVRNLGNVAKRPPLDSSLPTDQRFAALSERYASLKAKIEGNDAKQKNQSCSPSSVESIKDRPNSDNTLASSKCWTTVESIPMEEFLYKLSIKRVEELHGKQKGDSEENNRTAITSSEEGDVKGNDVGTLKTVSSVYGHERDITFDRDIITTNNDNNNNSSSVNNNNTRDNLAEVDVETDRIRTSDNTALNLRPETPTQRTRTSVVAKLMDRKMGIRRKQSIMPLVTKRRSKVYKEYCHEEGGIPATVAQFEKIRTLFETTVLRVPVRQEALTIQELLNGLSSCLTEIELIAVCKECSKTLRTLDALGSLPSYVSLESVIINPSGTIKFKHLSTGISIDDLYVAPEYSNRFASEKTCVFSLAATLWSAADWRLTEAQKPSLSPRFQGLLVSMTDNVPDARPGLYDVLQTCESLQNEGDMTSRERCQALLWEYQASAAIGKEDATKRKTSEEEKKKNHDTLMGSISVAASFKGFLKQTAKPQERNLFVKTQKNQEQHNKSDGKLAERISTNTKGLQTEEAKAEKDAVVADSQTLKDPSSNNEEKGKITASSESTNDSPPGTDTNNNPTSKREQGYSLTEDQKEQLLSLLASGKLNKTSSVTENNVQKIQEPTNQRNKAVEDRPVEPPSPSLYAYPQFAQTEAHMTFSPITPAGRSASPSMHSDISDSHIPVVPSFVPVAVPIPSVAPVPMPPFWYMPQGGMMPYPQPAMSPMQYAPVDPSVASNRSVVSADSDVSEMSDVDPRPQKPTSAIPRFDQKAESRGPTFEKDTEQRSRRSTALQNNKASKLPRPIWKTPVTKSRANPVESETNSNVVRRGTPISNEFNERNDEVKPVRARTPSPSLGRRSSPKAATPPRSQTPPVYWNREGVDISTNNSQERVSNGSFPSWRPSSPSSSPDARRRSCASPSRSRSDSPVQKSRGSNSRPSSPAGSRSNSPVSILASKFEQMSKESSDNSPRVRSTPVSSMISKFGSSSLVPEDRMVKGQFKPNMTAASAVQASSKTGPLRPSTTRDRSSDYEPACSSISSYENPISSRGRNRSRTSMSSDDDELSLINNSVDPREVRRSGFDPRSNGNGDLRCPLSSSLGNLNKASQDNNGRCQGSEARLLETTRKWSSQKDITQDSRTDVFKGSVQERSISGLSLMDDYSAKKEMLDEKDSTKARPAFGTTSRFAPSKEHSRSSSVDLRNESIIKPNDRLHHVLKPWQSKDGNSMKLDRKPSLDSEPVREKGSPKSRPRDICIIPERDNSMQYCDTKGSKDFLWSPPTSDTRTFEIPVDLAILESTTHTVSSPLNSMCGFNLSNGGRDGSVLSPADPLGPGSLKDFKPSNYFTRATFKCGEMEPERDTNCLRKAPSRESVANTVTNRRDPKVNYVRRFERAILRSTGDTEDEAFLSNLGSDRNQNVTSINETKENPRPVTRTPAKNKPISTNRDSSAAKGTSSDSKILKSSSKTDLILRSRLTSGDGSCLTDRASASTSINPPSPMTLKRLISNPLPREDNTSRTRPSTSKRNSLPTTQPINLSSNRGTLNGPMKKSSSQTNVSQSQKQFHKSSSQINLSPRQTAGDLLPISSSKGTSGKGNPHSKPTSSNNPHSKEEEMKGKRLETRANPRDSSKERQSSKELNKERNPHSSNPHRQATKTQSEIFGAAKNSESSSIRYLYTRRASTPAKGSPTIKPPPKAASNPPSPLYPKQPNDTSKFFGESNTYPGNPRGSISQGNPKSDHMNFVAKGAQHHGKQKQRTQSSGESSAASSGVGSSPMASPPGSFSRNSFASPNRALSLEQPSSADNPTDSDVFYVPYSGETSPKSEQTSAKTTTKRFPSSSSSDSGLNMSDPDETRKGNGKGNKSNRVRLPPTSPSQLPSPTSPKFPIGSNIFYEPGGQQTSFSWPDKGSSDAPEEPRNLRNASSNGQENEASNAQENEASNALKSSATKSTDSPDKAARSDSDKFKNRKGEVSKMQDKISVDANERVNSLPEKPKDITTALKVAAIAEIVRSTSKERLASTTPPPDLPGRPSSKSPPSSSRVDSKELLGQLVKKVLNSAAAKQGSSPKASFVESSTSTARENGKGRDAGQGKMFFSQEETIAFEEKEKSHPKKQTKTTDSSKQEQRVLNADKTSKKKEQGEKSTGRKRDDITANASGQYVPAALNEAPITPRNASKVESSPPQKDFSSEPKEKDALSKIIDLIHDEFAFDGYLDDGVEDVNMAEYVLSLAGMSEDNFKEAITDQYSDLYWDEDLLHDMYEAVVGGQQPRRPTLQFSESTVSDTSPPESINLSREESYLSLEPLYFNSDSRSSSERSGTGAKDILVSALGEATEFLPIKVIAPEIQADIQELLTPIFEDYHRVMGIKLASSVEDLSDKLGTKIMEISQQLMLERRAKKKSMNSYNKMADVENKRDVKDLACKLVNEIEEGDKKIIYLKNVQRQLGNVYAERFGLDTPLLYSFLESYSRICVTLEPELNNGFLNFSPIWNQRINESTDIVDESFNGPSLLSGTKLGLFSYLFDRHAMSQSYVRYFLYTYRYIATPQELFTFIREKCSASLRTDSSGQVYNHQLQIRYRALDLLSEWIDGYYQFDFKTNPNLIKELLAFVKDELILVDRSERGHYLMELITEKQKQDLNNNSLSEEITDFVAVLQLEDPQGPIEGKKDSPKKPLSSRKAKSPVQCFRRTTTEKGTTYKATLYLKALSVLDHSSRVLAEQLTLIQQDLFFHIHPTHFLNSRAHGIGVGRNQSPTRERDSIFGFSTGSRRGSEFPASDQGPQPWENNLYVSEPSTDGALEDLLEHAQDVSLWVAVEICGASSIKAQLALITKFVNAARYCCEIRNYSTCIQIIDALEMFVVRHLPVWKQVPTKTTEVLEELKAVKVLLKTDSSWLMKSESSREKPTIPCFLLFVMHVQQQELGGFTLPSDMYKWTKMRSVARLVDQLRMFKQMRYAFQTDEELKERLKQRIDECKNENLHALASENASNFHLSSSHGSRKFHDAFKKMKATFGGHN